MPCVPWLVWPSITALFLASLPAAQAEEPRAGTFVLRIADNEYGRESFELSESGWHTKGSLDLAGRTKSDYEIREERAGGVRTITFRSVQDGQDVAIDAELSAERYAATVQGVARTLELAGKPTPLPYQNLVWAYLVDIGQELAARVAAGSLAAGDELALLELASATTFELEVRAFTARTGAHDGQPLALLQFEVQLASVEATLLTTESGTPLSFRVPAQLLVAAMAGYEDALPPEEPRTLVDSGPWRAQLSKPEHEVVTEKGVRAAMRDGVELVCDVFRPKTEGKFATILVRTPYGRAQGGLLYGGYFARRGYAVVSQDVRGRFDSGGRFEPMRNETADGSDTLDWIATRPWSDGKVGMIGGSYLGYVQWAAAKSSNPHLVALVSEVAPPDPQYNIPFLGGTFFLSSVWWARVVDDMSTLGGGGKQIDWMSALATLPLSDLDKAFGLEHSFLDDWIAHPPHDPWWEAQSYQASFARMDVPALHISGWYDGDQPGAPMNYVGMRKHAKSERARKNQHLVMGPWTHIFNTSTRIGRLDFGPGAVIDLDSVTLRWFDHWLKGIDNGVEREDPVSVFTMVANEWHREQDWPLPQTAWTKLYLAGDGNANRRDGGGTLALAPAADSPPDHYAYDPARMPDIALDFDDLSGAQATRDGSQDPEREDVLDFTSPPLAHALELTGPFSAVLAVTTDAQDTDFVVSLVKIAPDGTTLDLRGGIQRLRYRSGYAREDRAEPGELSTLTIDLWATGIRLEKGDRLRVEVSSSGFPGTARNLNTGEPDATGTRMVVANQTVYHDAARPSYVLLPVIPRTGAGALEFAPEAR